MVVRVVVEQTKMVVVILRVVQEIHRQQVLHKELMVGEDLGLPDLL
jgi:hypothetical protein